MRITSLLEPRMRNFNSECVAVVTDQLQEGFVASPVHHVQMHHMIRAYYDATTSVVPCHVFGVKTLHAFLVVARTACSALYRELGITPATNPTSQKNSRHLMNAV